MVVLNEWVSNCSFLASFVAAMWLMYNANQTPPSQPVRQWIFAVASVVMFLGSLWRIQANGALISWMSRLVVVREYSYHKGDKLTAHELKTLVNYSGCPDCFGGELVKRRDANAWKDYECLNCGALFGLTLTKRLDAVIAAARFSERKVSSCLAQRARSKRRWFAATWWTRRRAKSSDSVK